MAYLFLRSLIRLIIHLVARVEFEGMENLPEGSSYAIASNHLGLIDALLVYDVFNRRDLFIPVAEKWEKYAILRWVGKHLNFIFIDRFNPDIHAIREILRRMDKGQILIIAPEGTRSRVESLQQGKPGISYLALKAG